MNKKLFITGLLLPLIAYITFSLNSKPGTEEDLAEDVREVASVESGKIKFEEVQKQKEENQDKRLKELDPKVSVKAINEHAQNILEEKISKNDFYDFTESDKQKILSQVIHFVDLSQINYQDIEATVVALMNDQMHEVDDRNEDYDFDETEGSENE